MKKIFSILGLSREAILFDSKLYIVKAMLAIGTGYVLAKGLPITRLDLISVLFGLMCSLEPINIIGFKTGINQLVASVLGAAATAIILLFFGINVLTIVISMGLTIYLALKIDWRMVSPVAIFTSIYMTQFVQHDLSGNPSVWLTFRLRIVALGFGILVAILFNYVFSFFYYREIAFKRLEFVRMRVLNGLEYTENQLYNKIAETEREYINIFSDIFNDLDLVHSNIEVMLSESKYSFKQLKAGTLMSIQKIIIYFRHINHLAYDINFIIYNNANNIKVDKEALEMLRKSIETLKSIDFTNRNIKTEKSISGIVSGSKDRVSSNISSINAYIDLVIGENI